MRAARRPTPDAERDEAMRAVAQWTEDIGKRCWAYIHRSRIDREQYGCHEPLVDTFADYIVRWNVELDTPIPCWLDLKLLDRPIDPSLVRYVERSGFKLESLVMSREVV